MKIKIVVDKKREKQVRDFIKKQPSEFHKAVKIGLLRIGLAVRNSAGRKAPYRTSTLRRSLTHKTDKNAIYDYKEKGKGQMITVGSNLVYARIQEFGGRTGRGGKGGKGKRGATVIRARNFLTPPFRAMQKGGAKGIISKEIEIGINKANA